MVTEELLRYVEYQTNRGVEKNSIKMTLLQAGWNGDDIREAFTVVETVATDATSQASAQSPGVTSSDNATAVDTGAVSNAENQPQTDNPLSARSDQSQAGQPLATVDQATDKASDVGQSLSSAMPNMSNDSQSGGVITSNAPATTAASGGTNANSEANPTADVSAESAASIAANDALKYRTGNDWQSNPLDKAAQNVAVQGQPVVDTADQARARLAELQASVAGTQQSPLPASTAGSAAPAQPTSSNQVSTKLDLGTGSVYRPKVSNAPGASGSVTPATNLNNQLQNVAATTTGTVAGNPAQMLAKRKKQQSEAGKKSKGPKLIGMLIILVILAAAGFYVFQTYFSESGDSGAEIQELLQAMNNEESIQYRISGAIPVSNSIADSESPLLASLNQDQFSIDMQGLVEPASNSNGFSLEINEETQFEYVYHNEGSFGKISELPDDVKASYPGIVGNWFSLTDSKDAGSLLRLLTEKPPATLPGLGDDVLSALTELYQDGLIEIDKVAKNSDVIKFNIDVSNFTSRLNSNAIMVTELLEMTGATAISGDISIYPDTKLVRAIDLSLDTSTGAYPLSVIFDYTYGEKTDQPPVSAPSNVMPAATIISRLQSLLVGGEIGDLTSKLNLLGSSASVYFNDKKTYVGFCESEAAVKTNAEFKDSYGRMSDCVANETNFAYQLSVTDPGYFVCVDNRFAPIITGSAIDQTVIACGPAVEYKPVKPASENATANQETADATEPETSPNTISDDEFFQ